MNRRDFLKLGAVAVSMPLVGGPAFAGNGQVKLPRIELDQLPEKETEDAVIYHCDFPQEDRFHGMLTNIRNHLAANDFDPFRVKIIIVANGVGVKFFMKTHKGTKWEKEKIDLKRAEERLAYLAQFEVEYYICDFTIKGMKLKYENFFDFVKIVPSGVASIGRLQQKGFGYIKVL
jgi:intracellular sulfur oxidation DsrE/DsrF family protein